MARKKSMASKSGSSADSKAKKPDEKEKDENDPRPNVDENTVISRNKVNENDDVARERVAAKNPGKNVVDETDVGVVENPNAPGKLPDPPAKAMEEAGAKPTPDDPQARKEADERIAKRVDAITTPGARPDLTVKGENETDVPMGDALSVATPSPDAEPVSEEAAKRMAPTSFVIDKSVFTPTFRNGWVTGLVNFITDIEHHLYQTVTLGKVGPLSTMVEREDSFNSLIMHVVNHFTGIAHDVDRTTSFVEGFKHTDYSKMGFNLLTFYNSLPDVDQQSSVVQILRTMADVKKQGQVRGSLNALMPYERDMYVVFQEIEKSLEIPYVDLRKYVLSKKNTEEAMQPPKEEFRLEYARAAAPPDPTLVHEFMRNNPVLVLHWAPKLLAWVDNNMSLPMQSDTFTVDDILSRMGFKVGTIDGIKKFLGNMTTTSARNLAVSLLTHRLFAPYFEYIVEVDIDTYSFNTLLSATMWRLFPKHFIAKEWRITMNNWVLKHFIAPFYLTDAQRATMVWDRDEARLGTTDYLEIAFTTYGAIPHQVRAFWDPDNGWGDTGAYEPYTVDPEAMAWERTTEGHLYVPMAGRRLDNPNVTLQSMSRFSDYVSHYSSKRRPNIGGNTLHGETYGKILTFISGKVRSHSSLMYMLDELAMSMGPGMPLAPWTRKRPDEVYNGVQRTSVDIMAPLALLVLGKTESVTGPPLTNVFKAVESGMTMNAKLEALIDFYHYFWSSFNDRLRTNSEIVDAFKALLPYNMDEPFSFIFDKWKEAPLKTDIKFPPPNRTRGIWTKKLKESASFIRRFRELFGFDKYVYLVPPYSSETVAANSVVFNREWVPPNNVDMIKLSRTDMIDAVTQNRFATIYDDAMKSGKMLRIEAWHHFDIEKVRMRPKVDSSSLLDTSHGLKAGYAFNTLKWFFTLNDEKFLEDRREDTVIIPPMIVIPRPTQSVREMTPSEIFGLLGTIDARKDMWTFHDFSDFTAVTRETATSRHVAPFEK